MKCFNTISALVLISVMPGLVQGTVAYSGENLAKTAKITMEQATGLALEARPGNITGKELEREKGGSGLRYSFDILSHGLTYEVGIDAQTGIVVENGREGAHPD
jgi:uncharacterized membrane protein YkoI